MEMVLQWLETGKGYAQIFAPGDWITLAVLLLLFLMWIRLNRVTRQAKVARELIQAMTALQTEMSGIRDGLIGIGQDLRDARGSQPPPRPEAAQQK